MSPHAAKVLELEIMPIIAGTVPCVAKPRHAEDRVELVLDVLARAAKMLHDAEKSDSLPSSKSIAFYAIQRAKSVRRSYRGSRLAPLSHCSRSERRDSVLSLNTPLDPSPETDVRTLADLLQDPATACEKKKACDWRAQA